MSDLNRPSTDAPGADAAAEDIGLFGLVLPLIQHWKLWILGSLGIGLLALAVSFMFTPVFTARTTILPPQQQGGAAAALASLGNLAGLGGAAALKSPADQYVALMLSTSVLDRLVDRFDVMAAYELKYRFQARSRLETATRITVGKRDGLITIEVDDTVPQRAADMANAYVEELRRLTSVLAISEAKQRRVFFEKELKEARGQLDKAQQALQATGFSVGALRAEPRSAADGYARLKAEVASAEVRLRMLRGSLSDAAPEVQRELAALAELRAQVGRLEQAAETNSGPDYLSKYREYKYRETVFDLFARQYEIARVDESREGALVQVVDPALVPEYKSKPKRSFIAVGATLASLLLIGLGILLRHFWHSLVSDPHYSQRFASLRDRTG